MTYIQGTQHQEEGAPRGTCAPSPKFWSQQTVFLPIYQSELSWSCPPPPIHTRLVQASHDLGYIFFFACQDFLMSCNKDTSCHTHPTLPQSLPHPTKRCYLRDIVIFFLGGDNLTLPQEANMYIIKKTPKAQLHQLGHSEYIMFSLI